ncbi:MAG: hypothetical protein CVU61_02050 [Deltaproteobacteria bacterium HGW-Deltaproteobacteria-19]|jgi:hypothetical protein|nr:MAG: hypothetical protein CVU61_02050 [Deltaproteobacteria bacterium HGW-Deltaproteobacteria-19]
MKFRCPYCSKECDYLEIRLEGDLLTIIKMQVVFGKHAHLVWTYTELFGIRPMRSRAKKIRVLQEEMKSLFQAEAFTYNRRTYRISTQGIAEALNIIVHRHFDDPLENHNYLKKIMITIAEREAREAGRSAEQGLKKREEIQRTGGGRKKENLSVEGQERLSFISWDMPSAVLTDEQIEENKRRVKGLLLSLGG